MFKAAKRPVILDGALYHRERDPLTGEEEETFVPGVFAQAKVPFALLPEARGIGGRYLWYQAARCGREVDVGNLIAFGSAAGEGKRTHEQGNHPMHLHAALAFLALVVLDAACVILLLRHAHKRLNLSEDATRDTGFPGSGWS